MRRWVSKGAAAGAAIALGLGVLPFMLATSAEAAPVPPATVTAGPSKFHHYVVTVAGRAVAPTAGNEDPVLLRPGESSALYLPRLWTLERSVPAADLGPVYTGPHGITRLRVLATSPQLHESEISAYRQSLNTPANPATVRALAREPGIRSLQWILPGAVAVTTSLNEAQVSRLPGVVGVAPNGVSTAMGSSPNDPYLPQQWALSNTGQPVLGVTGTAGDDISANRAWSMSTGSGVTVAVIDTGAQPNHPDLAGVFSPASTNLLGETTGFAPTGNSADMGHGTHVTGIIAAHLNNGLGGAGVAPGATILEIKASNNGVFYNSTVEQGIYYALAHGAKVINLSLSSTSYDPTLEAAIQQAQADGALVVVAAGNSDQNIDPTSADPNQNTNPDTTYPAALPESNIISVGASTQQDTAAPFSNYGATAVDVFAPGQDILSTYPNSSYAFWSGTSMATPMVSGTAALIWARDPSLTDTQVKSIIMKTVTKAPALVGLCASGGVVNAGAAVAAASPPVSLTFRGFNAISAQKTAATSITAKGLGSGIPASTPLAWRFTLGVNVSGAAKAVANEPMTVGSGTATASVTTNKNGVALYAPAGLTASTLSSGEGVPLSASYPWQGTYAFAAALVPASNPSGPALTTQAVFFRVAGSSASVTTTKTGNPVTSLGGSGTGTIGSSGTSSGTGPSSSSGGSGSSGKIVSSPGPSTANPPTSGTTTTAPLAAPSGAGMTPAPVAVTPERPSTSSGGSSLGGRSAGGEPVTSSPGSSTGTTSAGTTSAGTTPGSGQQRGAPGTSSGVSPGGSSTGVGPFGLLAVSPDSSTTAGGVVATVTGLAIPSGSQVSIGGEGTAIVTDNAPNSLSFTVGPHIAGVVSVVVTAPDGQSSTLPNSFSFLPTIPETAGYGGTPGGSTQGTGGGSSGTEIPAGGTGTAGTNQPSSSLVPSNPSTDQPTGSGSGGTGSSGGGTSSPGGVTSSGGTSATGTSGSGGGVGTQTDTSSSTRTESGRVGSGSVVAPNTASFGSLAAGGDLGSVPVSLWQLSVDTSPSVIGISV